MPDLSESLAVAAPASLVYDLVADLPGMAQWSPECERVTWRGGATHAAGGVQFVGHNRAGSVRWMTQGEIVTAEPGRCLAFEIRVGLLKVARWEYLIVPDSSLQGCTVTEEWTDRRPQWFRRLADLPLGPRTQTNLHGILTTLANLKRAAETETTNKAQPAG